MEEYKEMEPTCRVYWQNRPPQTAIFSKDNGTLTWQCNRRRRWINLDSQHVCVRREGSCEIITDSLQGVSVHLNVNYSLPIVYEKHVEPEVHELVLGYNPQGWHLYSENKKHKMAPSFIEQQERFVW